jgi:hypothetical protein
VRQKPEDVVVFVLAKFAPRHVAHDVVFVRDALGRAWPAPPRVV